MAGNDLQVGALLDELTGDRPGTADDRSKFFRMLEIGHHLCVLCQIVSGGRIDIFIKKYCHACSFPSVRYSVSATLRISSSLGSF